MEIIENNKRLKKIAFVLAVICFTSCSHQFIDKIQLLRHHTSILWSESQVYTTPLLCYPWGKNAECDFLCNSSKDMYNCTITTDVDTIKFGFSKAYIPTNADSVTIKINKVADTSRISIIPGCSWHKHHGGLLFVKGSHMNEYCHIYSTTPVAVEVYIIVDYNKKNKNKDIHQLIEDDKQRKIKSLIKKMQ